MNLNWFHFLTSGMRIANRISVMLVKGGGMSLDKVTFTAVLGLPGMWHCCMNSFIFIYALLKNKLP